jgi:CRP-like cAMP-binding protein
MDKERLRCLARFNLLAAMNSEEMAMFNREVKDTKYNRGETIYLPSDPSDAVYFVKMRRVKLSHRDKGGNSVTIRVCKPGEPFGEMGAMG